MKKALLIALGIIGAIVVIGLAVYFLKPMTLEKLYSETESGIKQETVIAEGNTITIKDFKFTPILITIKVGETVTWINQDSVKHTVTSETGSELNSNLFGKDETYSHQFKTAGTYEYYCVPHPSMKGTVVVI